MEIFTKIKKIPDTSIALGFFDGIHLAHREVIKKLINVANEKNQKTAIISFSQNPANYFNEKKVLAIQTFKDKEIILQNLNIDYFFELDFEKYKDMEALDYLRLLVDNFSPKNIVVGFDHQFGKNKEGNVAFLKEYETLFDYECVVEPEKKILDEKISSSTIRKHIEYGNLEIVKEMLGRPFSVRNSVTRGDGIAKTLGTPTANIIWSDKLVQLPYGVYFGYAQLNDSIYPALISWGEKPTLTNEKKAVLEAHLYGLKKDIYGQLINISFDKKIRNQEKFPNTAALKRQIQKDYQIFKQWIENTQNR